LGPGGQLRTIVRAFRGKGEPLGVKLGAPAIPHGESFWGQTPPGPIGQGGPQKHHKRGWGTRKDHWGSSSHTRLKAGGGLAWAMDPDFQPVFGTVEDGGFSIRGRRGRGFLRNRPARRRQGAQSRGEKKVWGGPISRAAKSASRPNGRAFKKKRGQAGPRIHWGLAGRFPRRSGWIVSRISGRAEKNNTRPKPAPTPVRPLPDRGPRRLAH